MHADSMCTGNGDCSLTTGQQYRQITSFIYLGGAITETPNLSDEINRKIRVGWINFRRYTRELYYHPKASLLPLKPWMVRSEVVVEALLYGYATRATTTCPVQYTTGCCFES